MDFRHEQERSDHGRELAESLFPLIRNPKHEWLTRSPSLPPDDPRSFPDGITILQAAELAAEPIGRGVRRPWRLRPVLVRILGRRGARIRAFLQREAGFPHVLACLTPVHGPLTVLPLGEAQLPKLISRDRDTGLAPLEGLGALALKLDPSWNPRRRGPGCRKSDIGTTTLRLLLIRPSDGVITGEPALTSADPRGADVISRIVAAEKGFLGELAASVRGAVGSMIAEAAAPGTPPRPNPRLRGGGERDHDPPPAGGRSFGIRRVPSSRARWLSAGRRFGTRLAGRGCTPVYTVPGRGRLGGRRHRGGRGARRLPVSPDAMSLYVDLGTNGEIVLGGADFALACACSVRAGFRRRRNRCGMRADRRRGGRALPSTPKPAPFNSPS